MNNVSFRAKTGYVPESAIIKKITPATETEKIFSIQMPENTFTFFPGQFVQTSVLGIGEAPFSICSSPLQTEEFDICVRTVGHVSDALHRLCPGDRIGIRGPYGRGFPMENFKKKDLLIIAGGIGLAPLRSLITYALAHRKDFGRLILVYGAKTPSAMLFRDDLSKWTSDIRMKVYSIVDKPDDTWKGPAGVVTDPLKAIDIDAHRTVAAVVGPPVIFRFVAAELLEKNMNEEDIYFSLERRFQCGIGKCGHCQLNDLYVCQDGPVFSLAKLMGRTEAIESWAPEEA